MSIGAAPEADRDLPGLNQKHRDGAPRNDLTRLPPQVDPLVAVADIGPLPQAGQL